MSWLFLILVLWTPPVYAGQIILTMPDAQIQSTLKQVGTWWHAWRDGASYASDTDLVRWVVDRLVQVVSMNHYQTLAEVGGVVEIRYDEPREPVVP